MRQIYEPKLKPCPRCNTIVIFVDEIDFPKGKDEGYKIGCQCGFSTHILHKWYSNKTSLIWDWNERIIDAEFEDI